MATILYDSPIFGPVISRRLGVSLGINLLPSNTKLCSFECIYCECGFTPKDIKPQFAEKELVLSKLRSTLHERHEKGEKLDVITFAGNGEPTMHPQFEEIIVETKKIRDQYFPNSKISVLSNATMLHKESVVRALKLVDNNLLKLDSGINKTALLIDQPNSTEYDVRKVAEQMKQFDGKFILQTIFLKGVIEGQSIDNTTEEEVNAWLELVKIAQPQQIMMYSIDRDTPIQTLQKVSKGEMEIIADKARALGFTVSVAG